MVSILFLNNYHHLYASGVLQTATRSTGLFWEGRDGFACVGAISLSKKNKSNETTFTGDATNIASSYMLLQAITFN